MSFSPEQLDWMNQEVYKVDSNYSSKGFPVISSIFSKQHRPFQVGDMPVDNNGNKYKIISTCPPDSNHAFTAFALVAPMNGNSIDENNVVVVAGGTWPGNGRALADAGTEKTFGLSP